MNKQHTLHKNIFNIIVIVAALGYFVDIYDLILFSIVRVPSLRGLGITDVKELKTTGIYLLNTQMVGMLVGGILWGILGDKKGRLSVLFFTILLYSIANIANGFITNINQYYVLRFIAGVGLAGELGIGITLVSEVMTKETRGYGTTLVSGIGISGAVVAFLVTDLFDWRMAFWVGGGLGLILLFMRMAVYESGMYAKTKSSAVSRGNFFDLFRTKKNILKYLKCIFIGVPVWYVIGIIVFLAPEIAKNGLHVHGEINGGKAVMFHYIGASTGAFLTGLISQWLKSRRKALLIALSGLVITLVPFFMMDGMSANMFYFMLLLIGIPNGYWSVFVTNASEQFGTNLRSTVTTTTPNLVRGITAIMTLVYASLNENNGVVFSAVAIGIVVIALAFYSTITIEESFHKDLDYVEEVS